ncbi:glycoside hydrolase family 5 protein [Cerasicoccus arenae]|uniref:Glycoside hydrolase family 5 domain-containing protein n=1 Tax=Cerasicoccus arenae TaxID=424488 RepID=A0A8J3GDE3_9BACT|nr:glycoside hydrolase family 5 protein [Cerasicoccus arenae]MBK1857586.1 glycoside hydrolase family 5 protein [Cerasicoccus arenae]GHC05747.1 hypothetical protein GCM10007047_23390 [Cerasicoccus arenae]
MIKKYPNANNLLVCGLLLYPMVGNAAIVMESWSSAPWNLTGGATSFAATQNDPSFEGGTDATFIFANPLTGVDVSTPIFPDNTSAVSSLFGVEGTGFGVAESGVGRFDRGESFSLTADHAFQLSGISWTEYQGDEAVHLTWTSGGIQYSELLDLEAGSFYTTTVLSDIMVDANTAFVITNVSDGSAGANGRLRVRQVIVELIAGATVPTVGETHRLQSWSSSPWNLSAGNTAFSGNVSDTTHGMVYVSFLDPIDGIDVSNPNQPDYTSATASYFGVEGTGFGVGESTVGRFDSGESFVIQTEQAFELQSIRWAEYTGDEILYLSWISEGAPLSATIPMGAGSFYTEVPFDGIFVDAGTPLEITNASDSSAYANGRLRVNYVDIAFQTTIAEVGDLLGAHLIMGMWNDWPWNAEGGDATISGSMIAPENGGTNVSFTFTAQSDVDITNPNSPDFTSATSDIFGFEPTGFGVGESTLGRFNRGESVTLVCDHDYQLDTIRWREVQGDEQIHLSWIQDGVAEQAVITVATSETNLVDLIADANTALVMTNVSPITSPLDGRLRINDYKLRLHYDTQPSYDHSGSDGFVQMMGVNLAGAEFGGFAFWQDDPLEWNYYHSKGLDLIRIPFKWERVQASLYGAVDFSDMDTVVALANARGMKVVLDMHNYARLNGNLIGTTNVPNAAFADVWRKIADHYKNETAIYGYGIMNEPHSTGGLWPAAAQAAVDGIRDVDTVNWVIVGGENYSSASTWRSSNPNLDIQDAYGKVMYEAHIYFDQSWPAGDGSYGSFDSETPADDRGLRLVQPFLLWLQEKDARGFLGEYGVPKNDVRWLPVLDNFMAHIHAYGLSGTYWAGGENWSNYVLDCSPTNNYTVDSNQMSVLENYTE